MGDALRLVAEKALTAGRPVSAADRHQVVIHMGEGQAGTAVLENGTGVSAETCRRFGCDASIVTFRHGSDGSVLDVGRRTRVVPPALRRALEHRDGGCCRFPVCHVRHTDAHHVRHWADGGETKLENLALLCRRHHVAVHEKGWRLEFAADGGLVFRDPRGRWVEAVPVAPYPGMEPVEALIRDLEERGVPVDSPAREPLWWVNDGFDLGYALQVMWRPRGD